MELILLGINILLVMAVWRFVLRKTILDHFRDKLFDLRSELREVFIANGWDLGSPAYKRLRNLINGHLRYTEDMGISKTAFFTGAVKENKELQQYMHMRIQELFATPDRHQSLFIEDFRRRALAVSLDYSIYSSGFFLLLALVMTPFVAIGMVVGVVNRQVDVTAAKLAQYVKHIGSYASTAMSKSSASVAKRFLLPDAIEAYSYRRGAIVSF